ncbi:hypothetical protein [Symbioplanes lichenis]|uniref:hypothetical protein n=1 Tax=Symbioplanes lichenis TaxID=1629072 RepID=UPI00273820DE|nr:hypothetical protein [Actinoplanes lichenis]
MSRVRYGSRAGSSLSRRRVLTIAAAVGVGASAAGVAGLSLAGENDSAAAGNAESLVLSLRDAKKGTFDLFVGESKVVITDKDLVKTLLKAAKKES